MDCLVQSPSPFWTGVVPHGLPSYHQRNYFPNFYFQRKRSFGSSYYPGPSLFFPHDDEVDYPTDIKGEPTSSSTSSSSPAAQLLSSTTMPYSCMADENDDIKMCVVCGERASGFYFGALVCLPCKSFYIRCTKEGEPAFTCQCSGHCDIVKQGRIRCQYCRYQRCLLAGMCRKEKPETVQPAEGQVLCKVCGDIANGIHFGVNTCEGCKKFFRRGLVENQSYLCKGDKDCGINPRNRNNCRYCRYQKCIGVGMSREAIKMGRPKKADGSDAAVSPLSAGSPKAVRRSLEEIDSLTEPPTNPSSSPALMREDSNDMLKSSSAQDKVKAETGRSSCEYQKKMGAMWSEGQGQQNMSSWQPCSQSQMSCGNAAITNSQPNMASTEFNEEEMDEILMLLQNDNQSGTNSWKTTKKPCYTYPEMMVHKECKTEFCDSPQGHWHTPEMPTQQQKQHPRMMASMNPSCMNEPVNMSTSHMSSPMATRLPPQYPGYNNREFQQQEQVTMPTNGMPAAAVSPCHSPNHPMNSSEGYMSDCSAQSPGYAPSNSPRYLANGSPVHSPSCQYSPQHSPVYQNCQSPQRSPYQNEASPQGSPYNENMYHPNTFNHQNNATYTDLSVNTTMMPQSPPQNSPPYAMTNTMTSNSGMSMTIPPQEGGVISHDSWNMTGSPSHYCFSPSSHSLPSPGNPQTIPSQERGYKRSSAWHSNVQRINQYFSMHPSCKPVADLQLVSDDEMDSSMTRSDIEREVVYKSLTSMNPNGASQYHYVMTDPQSCSSDSSCGTNYDEYTSCQRQNKRKSCDDSDDFTSRLSSSDGFRFGRYKRQITERYWQAPVVMEDLTMTTDKQALLEHLCTNFKQLATRCSEPTKSVGPQESHWQQIQLRIIRNMSAGVRFASQLPGFGQAHPEDRSYLCNTVTFMSTLLMAGHQLYNPAEKNFRDFWSWNIGPQNPFYTFKQHLLEAGETIHRTNMDGYEVSALSALLFLATDFTDLSYPELLEEARRKVLTALQAYELSKGSDVKLRISELFSLVPRIRHIGMWYQELMKHLKVNTQPQEVHQLYDNIMYRES